MISPWLIYLVGVLITTNSIVEFVFGFSLISTMILITCYFAAVFSDDKDKKPKEAIDRMAKWLKRSLIITIVSAILVCLIPTKETMYAMLIVDQLTPENIEAMRDFGVETVQQLGDAIANSINKIEVK